MAVAAEDRAAHGCVLTDARVGPDDGLLDRRLFLDVAVFADDAVRADARPGLDDRAGVDEARSLDDGPVLDARVGRDPRGVPGGGPRRAFHAREARVHDVAV